jgi:hypothetical protein
MNRDTEHAEMTELMPWYVNGTLKTAETDRLERHLAVCAVCREDLALERSMAAGLANAPAVEYLPGPALRRLNERLDALGTKSVTTPATPATPAAPGVAGPAAPDAAMRPSPSVASPPAPGAPGTALPKVTGLRSGGGRWLLAASFAAVALALAYLVAARYQAAAGPRADYRTVTTSAPSVPATAIRAVFAPNLSVGELERLLDEAGLRIVAGPTEAGVYSLAATTERPVSASLAALRRHESVRFAESTEPLPSSRAGAPSGAPSGDAAPSGASGGAPGAATPPN